MPEPLGPAPPTRWALRKQGPDSPAGYAEDFAELVAAGADVDGEARLADALVPRGARVLDVGSGMGRVAAALTARGHRVTAVEPDPALVAQSRATYPDLEVAPVDVLAHHPGAAYDLVVCVGNVLVLLAEGTERRVLAHLASMLAPGGRILAGYHLEGGPESRRDYPVEELTADLAWAGLIVQARFGSYELHPPSQEYAVLVIAADAVS